MAREVPRPASDGEVECAVPSQSPEVTGRHRDTLRHLFAHPLSHNVEWHDVVSLLSEIAPVNELRDGKLEVAAGDRTLSWNGPVTRTSTQTNSWRSGSRLAMARMPGDRSPAHQPEHWATSPSGEPAWSPPGVEWAAGPSTGYRHIRSGLEAAALADKGQDGLDSW